MDTLKDKITEIFYNLGIGDDTATEATTNVLQTVEHHMKDPV